MLGGRPPDAPGSPQSDFGVARVPPPIPPLPGSFWWGLLFGSPDVLVSAADSTRALQQVADKLGACWDPQLRQWFAIWQEKKGVPLPFSRQTYERYSQLISSFSLAAPNIKRIAEALKLLLGNLQPKDVARATNQEMRTST